MCGQTSINPCQSCSYPTTSTNRCQTPPTNPCETTTNPPPSPLTTSSSTTTSLPPSNIIECPPGTILIGEVCQLIYCPLGSVMQNDRCVFIECPSGTTWTGHRCSVPEPTVHNFTFNYTITTHANQTTPDIILNNTKTIVVNASVDINEHATNNDNCNDDIEHCDDEDDTTTPTTETTVSCCEVMTPRICEQRNNRWHCYSRRSRRCGDFCIAPIIYLKPPRIYAKPEYVIMPPIHRECKSYGTCGSMTSNPD